MNIKNDVQQVCELLLSNPHKRTVRLPFVTRNKVFHSLNEFAKEEKITGCCPLGMWALVNNIDDPYSFENEGIDIFTYNDQVDGKTFAAAKKVVDSILENN